MRSRAHSLGWVNTPLIVVVAILVVLALSVVPVIGSLDTATAKSKLEGAGYTVLSASEYDTILTRLDAIKSTALAAVVAAEAAVDAAELAAAKVDLFNSAEVFLFPNVTNVTITLTAGNTNVWSDWAEVVDSTAVTLSSKFAVVSGYVNDMYIYDHSAVDKLYTVELAYGPAKTILGRIMWHTSYKDAVQIKSRRVPAGSIIYYRVMSSGINGSTAKVGFRYFYE